MLLLTAAFAVPPDKIVDRLPVGGNGDLDHLTLSGDGELVAGRSLGNQSVFVLEVETWNVVTAKPCDVRSVAPVLDDRLADGTSYLYVGCADGKVHRMIHTAGSLVGDADDAGPVVYDLGTNPIPALFWDGTSDVPYIYAFENATPLSQFHVIDTAGETVDTALANFPRASFYTGFVDATTFTGIGGVGYLAHGNSNVSTVDYTTGNISFSPISVGAFYDFDDIALSLQSIWAVDTDLSLLINYDAVTGFPVATFPTTNAPKAVVANLDSTDEWLMVAGDGVRIHLTSNGAITDLNDPYYDNPVGDTFIQDAVTDGSYVYGGGSAGNLVIVTANPWVSGATATPDSGTSGTVVEVGFQVDEDASYEIRRGGSRTGGGTLLASGSADGGTPVSVELTIDDTWVEGSNPIYILAKQGPLTGHQRVDVVVDDVPTTPVLSAGSVGVSDNALILSFVGISDADLASYEVYISDAPFEPGDYVTGGPETFDGGPTNPISLPSTAGATVATTISGLENETTYYIGVRAIDAGGLESSMSNVVSGTPETTFTASDFSGETGGGPCSTGGAGGGWALLGGLFALLGRRRGAALGLLALSAPAMADEVKDKGDSTKQYGNFELRYGAFLNLEDEGIKRVYGNGGHNMIQVEVGPQITRFFEIDAQFSFYQELGNTVTSAGVASARRTMLTWYPLGLSATGRLQIFDEQIIVPHGRIGVDYVFYSELTDNGSGGKAKLNGSKMGFHYAAGASLLLDIFAPRRASLLEAQTGINDTYIVMEWRGQTVDSRKFLWGPRDTTGFDFSGSMLTVGLKLDY